MYILNYEQKLEFVCDLMLYRPFVKHSINLESYFLRQPNIAPNSYL